MENIELSRLLQARREKLDQLKERGIPPYAYRFERSHTAGRATELFELEEEKEALDAEGQGTEVRLAGRLMGFRGHGKSAFAHLEDVSGRIQVYFRKDVLGEDCFEILDLLDLGDWVGVSGPLFRTRTGEITVRAQKWELLSKSLRPLPIGKTEVDPETGERKTYGGFADVESRYRQRYADLAVHPEVREVFRTRSRIVRELRRFLDERDFLEVETPILQPLYGGASARPFVTHHNALETDLYLRIADELYLKRLIVGGMERVYEIGKDFRNEGIDRFHNPEFTMLEFYQAFADYNDMMELVEQMLVQLVEAVTGGETVTYQGKTISFKAPFARVSLVQALEDALGADPLTMDEGELRRRADAAGAPDLEGAGRGKLMDKLFEALIQPKLVEPTFIVDYPRELSPLAKPMRDDPEITERFELFVAGQELANAFSELNDPLDQRSRLEDQNRLREEGDEETHPIDEDYIRALEYGMPPTGGVGIGVDRLTMMLTDRASIRDVLLFPTLRPEQSG
jgi:lysyl-tRNA synthetase, class II